MNRPTPETIPLKDYLVSQGGFWNDGFAAFCLHYRGRVLEARNYVRPPKSPGFKARMKRWLNRRPEPEFPEMLELKVDDFPEHVEINQPKVPPNIKPAFVQGCLKAHHAGERNFKQMTFWVSDLTGEKANFIGRYCCHRTCLFLTESGRLISVSDVSFLEEWLSCEDSWDGAFKALLRGDEPVPHGHGRWPETED